DGATGDEAGAGHGRAEEDLAAIIGAEGLVGDGVALELHGEHVLPGALGGLLDGVGHLVGAAVADADLAGAVADDGDGGEGEATTTLHDLGAAVDEDDLLEEAGIILLLVAVVAAGAAVGTARTTRATGAAGGIRGSGGGSLRLGGRGSGGL